MPCMTGSTWRQCESAALHNQQRCNSDVTSVWDSKQMSELNLVCKVCSCTCECIHVDYVAVEVVVLMMSSALLLSGMHNVLHNAVQIQQRRKSA